MSRTPVEFAKFPPCLTDLLALPCLYGPSRAISRYDDRLDDGDTCLFMVDPGWDFYPIDSVRFLGINAPEKSTEDGKRVQALMATARYLKPGTEAVLITSWGGRNFGRDKYGRLLALVFVERDGKAVCLNTDLVRLGHATPYLDWAVALTCCLALYEKGLIRPPT